MIVVGSCYFLLTLLIPYDPNIDFVFPLSFYIRAALPQIRVETLIGSVYKIRITAGLTSIRQVAALSSSTRIAYKLNKETF